MVDPTLRRKVALIERLPDTTSMGWDSRPHIVRTCPFSRARCGS